MVGLAQKVLSHNLTNYCTRRNSLTILGLTATHSLLLAHHHNYCASLVARLLLFIAALLRYLTAGAPAAAVETNERTDVHLSVELAAAGAGTRSGRIFNE